MRRAGASLLLACCCLAPPRTRADVCGKPSKEKWEGECSASAVTHARKQTRRDARHAMRVDFDDQLLLHSANILPSPPQTCLPQRAMAVPGGCWSDWVCAYCCGVCRWAAGENHTARAFTCWRTGQSTRARYQSCCAHMRCAARAGCLRDWGEQERLLLLLTCTPAATV